MKVPQASHFLTYFGLVALRFINLPLTIAISIIIARVLSTTERGSYAILLLFGGFWLPLLSFGQGAAILYVIGGRRYSVSQAAVSATFIYFLIGIFVALLIFGLWYGDLLGEAAREVPAYEFYVLLGMIPLQALQLAHTRLLLADSWFLRVALFDCFNSLLFLFLLCLGLGWQFVGESAGSPQTFRTVINALVLTNLTLMFVKAVVLLKNYRLEWRINKAYLQETWVYGWRIWGSDIMYSLNVRGDQLILSYFVSASELGIYAIALVMSALLSQFPDSLDDMLLKKLVAESNPEVRRNLIERIHRLITCIMVPLTLLAGVILPPVALLFYGEKYLGAIMPFWLLLPGIVFSALAKIMSKYFAGIGQPGMSSKMALYGTVFGLALSALLLALFPEYGIKWAAIANSLGCLFTLLLFQKFYRQLPGHENSSLFIARSSDWSWLLQQLPDWRKKRAENSKIQDKEFNSFRVTRSITELNPMDSPKNGVTPD